jgi:hypothetical protein
MPAIVSGQASLVRGQRPTALAVYDNIDLYYQLLTLYHFLLSEQRMEPSGSCIYAGPSSSGSGTLSSSFVPAAD